MSFCFATADRKLALEHLKYLYKTKLTQDSEYIKEFLDYIGLDIIRIMDPMMHDPVEILPGKNWDKNKESEIIDICKKMQDKYGG